MSSPRLPLVPPGLLVPPDPTGAASTTAPSDDPACAGCSRRAVLGGFAGAAALLALGCGTDASSDDLVDAPATGVEACGPGRVCVDLGDSANAALLEVGGARVIDTTAGRLVIVRTTATEAAALSAICTHTGCTVRYDPTNTRLTCPCHGSRFALTGEVLRSPATRPLAVFPATLDVTRNVIEIVT